MSGMLVRAHTADYAQQESLPLPLDFDELLECIARCGVDKYRAVEQIKTGEKVAAMIANILGDLNEEQVLPAATYITAERFTPAAAPPKGVTPEGHKEWLMTWEMLQLSTLPGFPLWEKDVHDVLPSRACSWSIQRRGRRLFALFGVCIWHP